jgi:hypothetical protein
LATSERGGSPEGSIDRGAAQPEGNIDEGWRPVVEVGGSRLGKVVGTQAVVGAASMEHISGRRRLVPVTPLRWLLGGGSLEDEAPLKRR